MTPTPEFAYLMYLCLRPLYVTVPSIDLERMRATSQPNRAMMLNLMYGRVGDAINGR